MEFDKEETNFERIMVFSFHNFQWILSKLYVHVGGALQMCIRLFDTDVIDFGRITVFCNL